MVVSQPLDGNPIPFDLHISQNFHSSAIMSSSFVYVTDIQKNEGTNYWKKTGKTEKRNTGRDRENDICVLKIK